MTSSGNPVRGGMLGWLLAEVENRAPVTGITLSTRVGRLSETHSDTCIQLTQFPDGKKGEEPQGAKVSENSMV